MPEAGVQPSACRSLGLPDQHKQWSLEENTKVGPETGVWSGPVQGQWHWRLVVAEHWLCSTVLPLPLAQPPWYQHKLKVGGDASIEGGRGLTDDSLLAM